MDFRGLIVLTYVLFLLISIQPPVYSSGQYVEATIRITLYNGKPLPNATLRIVYGISKWVENISDHNGYVYLKIPKTINRLHLTIYYEPYPNPIYDIRNIDETDIPETIRLPYNVLNTTINIRDEYMEGINASYILKYSGEGVKHGEIKDGECIIDGRSDIGGYILVGVNSDASIKITDYELDILVMEEMIGSVNLGKIVGNNELIVDMYKPVVEVLNFTSSINRSLGIISLNAWIKYGDGINTNRSSVEAYYAFPRKGINTKTIPRKALISGCMSRGLYRICMVKYNELLAVIPRNYTTLPVKLFVKVTDPSDKENEVVEEYYVKISYTTTTTMPQKEGIGGFTNTNTSTNIVVGRGSRSNEEGGVFNPGLTSSSTAWFIELYYLGPLIGLGIAIYEFHRSRRGGVDSSRGGGR